METIEERSRGNIQLTLEEGGLFFERQGSVWTTLRKIAEFLADENIAYAVSGGLAAFHHGYRCYTEGIDVIVETESLPRIESNLTDFKCRGLSNHRFVDCETGVSVRFHLAGEVAGRSSGEDILFPEPTQVRECGESINYVNLPTLINLDLAAWSDGRGAIRGLANVQEYIKVLYLPQLLSKELHPAVRNAYLETCKSIDSNSGPFLLLLKLKNETRPVTTEEVAATGEDAALLDAKRDGVTLWQPRPMYEDYAVLFTNDRFVARKYDMHHESEYLFKE
ncbi:MAG TPA: hypothetical protein VGI40_17545 [Pirellulaceae bacterium]